MVLPSHERPVNIWKGLVLILKAGLLSHQVVLSLHGIRRQKGGIEISDWKLACLKLYKYKYKYRYRYRYRYRYKYKYKYKNKGRAISTSSVRWVPGPLFGIAMSSVQCVLQVTFSCVFCCICRIYWWYWCCCIVIVFYWSCIALVAFLRDSVGIVLLLLFCIGIVFHWYCFALVLFILILALYCIGSIPAGWCW